MAGAMSTIAMTATSSLRSLSSNSAASLLVAPAVSGQKTLTSSPSGFTFLIRCENENKMENKGAAQPTRRSLMSTTIASALAAAVLMGSSSSSSSEARAEDIPLFGLKKSKKTGSSSNTSSAAPTTGSAAPATKATGSAEPTAAPAKVSVATSSPSPSSSTEGGLTNIQQSGVVLAADLVAVALATATVQGLISAPSK